MSDNFKKLPEFGIGLKIETEPIPQGEALVSLILSVRECILNLDKEGVTGFERKKTEKSVTFSDTAKLFRRKERLANTKHILQYLMLFIEELPTPERARQLPENPFVQFREFVINLVADLKEEDVAQAVLREYEDLGILNQSNLWIHKGKIRLFHDKLMESLKDAREPDLESYSILVNTLKKTSLFWFGIRRENLERIRKSDLYIYKLSRVLQHKVNQLQRSENQEK